MSRDNPSTVISLEEWRVGTGTNEPRHLQHRLRRAELASCPPLGSSYLEMPGAAAVPRGVDEAARAAADREGGALSTAGGAVGPEMEAKSPACGSEHERHSAALASRACGDSAPSERTAAPLLSPTLARFARIVSGDGGTLAERQDDPALAVGLIMHFARTSLKSGLPMPPSVLRLLERHVRAGDPACQLVMDWLARRMIKRGKRQLWIVSGRTGE